MPYKPIIGLEIHCELNTESKMFCDCHNDPDEKKANVNICPICTGQPGTLPTANIEAIKLVMKTGLALDSEVRAFAKFDRKNYFYPDLPKGYQISQYDEPFCLGGRLEISGGDGKPAKTIRVRRVHLEEDTGRLVHPEGADHSLVDFNRSGVPLMELVTEPDIASAGEAREFVEELQLILRYLRVSDADMEKGIMRVEVNISLAEDAGTGEPVLGTKVEIKNLNSLRAVEGAVAFEIERQGKLLSGGGKVAQETRGWSEARGETYSQREKEEAFDYRYFPEPDIPPFIAPAGLTDQLKTGLVELPKQKRERFAAEYGLDARTIEIFVKNRPLGCYFEKTMSELANWVKEEEMKKEVAEPDFRKLAKLCSNYLITDVGGLLKDASFRETELNITPENFAEFITLIYEGRISSKIAKMVLEEMMATGADPSHVIEEKGLAQISDESELEKVVGEILAGNPKAVEDYKKGKENAFQFLVGQILSATRGKANPQMARLILKRNLDNL